MADVPSKHILVISLPFNKPKNECLGAMNLFTYIFGSGSRQAVKNTIKMGGVVDKIRWLFRIRCAGVEENMSVDLVKAFVDIDSRFKFGIIFLAVFLHKGATCSELPSTKY